MNLLHSRLEGQLSRLLYATTCDLEAADRMIIEQEDNQRYVARLVKRSYAISLRFANDLYVCRHLMTQAHDNLRVLAREAEAREQRVSMDNLHAQPHDHSDRGVLSTEARLARVATYLKAADSTLLEAESLLPRSARTIGKEAFWDRYRVMIDRRAVEAEKALVDMRNRPSQNS